MRNHEQEPAGSAGQMPFAGLPICLRGKVTPYELAVLWALQGRGQNCFPSIQQLSRDTSISTRTVCRVLADLERKGWIRRFATFRENGAKTSNRYQVTVWEKYMQLAESEDAIPHVPQSRMGVCATEAHGHAPDSRMAYATEAHEIDKSKKIKNERKNSHVEGAVEKPAERSVPARDPGPEPEPTSPPLAIAPRTATCPTSPDPAMAALVIEAWNRHKPATWPAIQRLGAKRWPVVVEWSQELGGFQEFLDAIPVALAAAARDPWWGQKAMDWANFMGHGPKSTKQHFLRFYERGMDQTAQPSAAAGLSQYVHRMFDHFGVDQSTATANPIDITESSRC